MRYSNRREMPGARGAEQHLNRKLRRSGQNGGNGGQSGCCYRPPIVRCPFLTTVSERRRRIGVSGCDRGIASARPLRPFPARPPAPRAVAATRIAEFAARRAASDERLRRIQCSSAYRADFTKRVAGSGSSEVAHTELNNGLISRGA